MCFHSYHKELIKVRKLLRFVICGVAALLLAGIGAIAFSQDIKDPVASATPALGTELEVWYQWMMRHPAKIVRPMESFEVIGAKGKFGKISAYGVAVPKQYLPKGCPSAIVAWAQLTSSYNKYGEVSGLLRQGWNYQTVGSVDDLGSGAITVKPWPVAVIK